MEGVAEWRVNSVMVSALMRKSLPKRKIILFSVAGHLMHGVLLGIVFLFLLFYLFAVRGILLALLVAVTYSILLWFVILYMTRRVFE